MSSQHTEGSPSLLTLCAHSKADRNRSQSVCQDEFTTWTRQNIATLEVLDMFRAMPDPARRSTVASYAKAAKARQQAAAQAEFLSRVPVKY